ncbi:MAG: DHH family phosphoesterase [Candidatus Nitrosocaldaceae archaeon]
MSICISHMEDADGIVSACIISSLFNTKNILVDYSTLMPTLRRILDEEIENLFICDLGLSKSNQSEFISIINQLKNRNVKVTYIDHHDQSDELKQMLSENLNLIHNLTECTSVIIYSNFKDRIEDRYKILVAAAAIVDEMDKNPIASTLVRKYDRQFLFFETTILSYAIYSSQKDMNFLLRLVEELKSKLPHEIEGVVERSRIYAEQISKIITIMEKAYINNGFAHISIDEPLDTGVTASMLLNMKELRVAMAYKPKNDGYVISLRGAAEYDKHLGRILSSVASEVGGSGGGHKLACGALIPKDKLNEFINRLERMI